MAQIELRVKNKVSIGELKSGTKKIAPPLIDLEVTPTGEEQVFNHEGEYGYDKVTVKGINLQDKVVNPTREEQVVKADDGFSGLNEVTINPPSLQAKTVTPTKESQVIEADSEYVGLNNVTVEAVTNEIDSNIQASNIRLGVNILGVEGNLEPDKPDQSKTVAPTKEQQTVLPDTGYELSQVTVEAIPDTYIEPTGTLDITTNGVHDVTNYASANVSVGGSAPTKGLIINSYNEDGFATDASIIGMTEIPDFYLYGAMYYEYGEGDYPGSFLNKVGANLHLPETLTKIGIGAFYNCVGLALTSLPSRITEIGERAFYGCSRLGITSLLNGIKRINPYTFYNCAQIPLAELPPELEHIGTYAFYYCPKLALTNLPDTLTYIDSHAFNRCGNLLLSSLPSGLTNLGGSSFRDCDKITINKVPSGITVLNGSTFYDCSSLTEMTLEGAITSISSSVFYGCSKLEKLIMPNVTKVPTLSNKNSFTNTPIAKGTGYIYVPDTLVDSFKSASNWSTYANQIKGVSEL